MRQLEFPLLTCYGLCYTMIMDVDAMHFPLNRMVNTWILSTILFPVLLLSGCASSPDGISTPTPIQTDTPAPVPTAVRTLTAEEQEQVSQWCKQFNGLLESYDQLQADAQAWFENLGHSPSPEDIDDAQVIVRMYLELYLQSGTLDRIGRVREINDNFSAAIYSEEFAYAYLHRALSEGSTADYDQYIELKGQAENGLSAALDRFNVILLEMSISTETCEILSK